LRFLAGRLTTDFFGVVGLAAALDVAVCGAARPSPTKLNAVKNTVANPTFEIVYARIFCEFDRI
jgi:hypothetical protein